MNPMAMRLMDRACIEWYCFCFWFRNSANCLMLLRHSNWKLCDCSEIASAVEMGLSDLHCHAQCLCGPALIICVWCFNWCGSALWPCANVICFAFLIWFCIIIWLGPVALRLWDMLGIFNAALRWPCIVEIWLYLFDVAVPFSVLALHPVWPVFAYCYGSALASVIFVGARPSSQRCYLHGSALWPRMLLRWLGLYGLAFHCYDYFILLTLGGLGWENLVSSP